MTIDPKMNEAIETEMASLQPGDYLKPGCAFDDYVRGYSRLLGQAEQDKALLVAAGFPYEENMPRYSAYQEKLALEHGERVNAEAARSDAARQFAEGMPRAEADRKVLMAMARYVVATSDKPEPKKVYDMIRKGDSQVDTLNDNIALVGFVRAYAELAAEVRPGGITVDEPYLQRVESNALDLLRLRGQAMTATGDATLKVDRQNRILTLCIRAERDIKRFADAAFFDDTERYNRDYARPSNRTRPAPEEPPEEPAPPTA